MVVDTSDRLVIKPTNFNIFYQKGYITAYYIVFLKKEQRLSKYSWVPNISVGQNKSIGRGNFLKFNKSIRAVTTGGAGGAIAPPIFLDGP